MMHTKRRARLRQGFLWVYLAIWLLTMLGVRSAEPQWFGIPRWYWMSGLLILLMIPVNLLFARLAWPQPPDDPLERALAVRREVAGDERYSL